MTAPCTERVASQPARRPSREVSALGRDSGPRGNPVEGCVGQVPCRASGGHDSPSNRAKDWRSVLRTDRDTESDMASSCKQPASKLLEFSPACGRPPSRGDMCSGTGAVAESASGDSAGNPERSVLRVLGSQLGLCRS
jgi:hypothetical protein